MDDHQEKQQEEVASLFQGDGICIRRILARESSVGQSSRTFHRSAEGVPFRWEMQPGTPKNLLEDEDVIPPICPSPLMQSVGLPLPNLDVNEPPLKKSSRIWRLREMVKKRLMKNWKKRESIRKSSFSSSSSSPLSRSNRVLDVSMAHAPFCCTPWNTPAILDEGNTKIYYCSLHKNAFAVEEDDFFLSRILSQVSAPEQFSGPLHGGASPAGIPFGWEMHPGTPKSPPKNEHIPPPSPPPAAQSVGAPPPPPAGKDEAKKTGLKKAWFWVRRYGKKKGSTKIMQHEMSFRYDRKTEEEFDASLRKSSSMSPPLSKGGWRVSMIRRNFEGKCGLWSRRRDVLVFARRKWTSFVS